MKFIDKKHFTKAVLYKDIKAFILNLSSLSLKSMTIYSAQKIALLLIEKAIVLAEWADNANVFLHELSKMLP